jgi:hypothetical protein
MPKRPAAKADQQKACDDLAAPGHGLIPKNPENAARISVNSVALGA